jgi:transmembrane sensor
VTLPDPIDWPLLDRYLAGECSEAERHAIEIRCGADSEFCRALEAARCIRDVGRDPAPHWEVDAVWQNVVELTATSRDPVQVAIPRPPGRRRRPFGAGFRRLSAAAPLAAGLVIAAAGGAWLLVQHPWATRASAGGRPTRTFATAPGERSTFALDDGTQVTLAPQSRLRVDAASGVDAREVTLEGEAVFVVVHDPKRPFVVHTAQAVMRDLGTTFDVQAYPEAATTRVVVAEGRVAVRGVSLAAGQVAVLEQRGPARVTSGAHVEDYLAWRTGRLVFDATPVPDVLVTLARWYDVDLRLGDPALALRHVTATYTNAPLDEVLTSLAATLGARVDRDGRRATLATLHPATRP